MRSFSRLPALLALVATALGGCQNVTQRQPSSVPGKAAHPVTYALAVTVEGGLHPTPAQWAAIQSTLSRVLAAQGLVLVSDVGLADRILRIDFTPDPADPENRGRAAIVGVRVNDQREQYSPPSPLAAAYFPYPTPFGWNGSSWNALHGFGFDPFYGYGNAYYDGYTYATPTMSPRRPAPPRHSCVASEPHPHRPHHTYPPSEPGHPRKGVPPAAAPTTPAVSATEPARVAAAPRAYPSSDPRELVFSDDIRWRSRVRFTSSDGGDSMPSQAGSRGGGTGSDAANQTRTYARQEREERAQSRSGTNGLSQSYARGDYPRSRSDEGQRQGSGSSGSSSSASHQVYSSGQASYSSYSGSNSAPSHSESSFSSGGSSSSGYSGAAAPSGGSGPSAAPTTTNQAEK